MSCAYLYLCWVLTQETRDGPTQTCLFLISPPNYFPWVRQAPCSVTGRKENSKPPRGLEKLCPWGHLEGRLFQTKITIVYPTALGSGNEKPEAHPRRRYCLACSLSIRVPIWLFVCLFFSRQAFSVWPPWLSSNSQRSAGICLCFWGARTEDVCHHA